MVIMLISALHNGYVVISCTIPKWMDNAIFFAKFYILAA